MNFANLSKLSKAIKDGDFSNLDDIIDKAKENIETMKQKGDTSGDAIDVIANQYDERQPSYSRRSPRWSPTWK